MLDRLQAFLIELGHDFCFVGSELPLQVDGRDFALDLLFLRFPDERPVKTELSRSPCDSGRQLSTHCGPPRNEAADIQAEGHCCIAVLPLAVGYLRKCNALTTRLNAGDG
ncbi:MAG: DUF1016 family protein [Burkholderiaceae bacterium]|nr:DUF1016 family protein [Burkholderiaceae bacterium]